MASASLLPGTLDVVTNNHTQSDFYTQAGTDLISQTIAAGRRDLTMNGPPAQGHGRLLSHLGGSRRPHHPLVFQHHVPIMVSVPFQTGRVRPQAEIPKGGNSGYFGIAGRP